MLFEVLLNNSSTTVKVSQFQHDRNNGTEVACVRSCRLQMLPQIAALKDFGAIVWLPPTLTRGRGRGIFLGGGRGVGGGGNSPDTVLLLVTVFAKVADDLLKLENKINLTFPRLYFRIEKAILESIIITNTLYKC